MENRNILTTEEALVKAAEDLKAATKELAAATDTFAKAAAGIAIPDENSEESPKAPLEPAPLMEKTEAGAELPEADALEEEAEVSETEIPEDGAEASETETPEEEAEVLEETETEAAEETSDAEPEDFEESEVSAEAQPEELITEEPSGEVPVPEKKTGTAANVFFTIIRLVLVAALVVAIVYYAFLRNQESNAPASRVFQAVEQSVATDKMEKTSERYFKKYYGLNAADYDAVLYYAPVSNMDAEELLIVKLKNVSQAETVTDAILKRQADKEQSFEGYAPEQYALAQDYILDVQGNYILFVVDPKAETIDAAFAGAL